MADDAFSWAAKLWKRDRSLSCLILAGNSGVGKTECLRSLDSWWMAHHFQAWGAPCSIENRDWPAYASSCRADEDWIPDVMSADVAFLDDVGSETDQYRSGIPTEVLRRVLGARERKWTVITTNVGPSAFASRWDNRVADRLFRNSVVCDLTKARSYVEF